MATLPRYGKGNDTWLDSFNSKDMEDQKPPVVEVTLEIDLAYGTRTDKELEEIREAEEEGMRYFDRGKFYKLIALPIEGMPDLTSEEEEQSGGGNNE